MRSSSETSTPCHRASSLSAASEQHRQLHEQLQGLLVSVQKREPLEPCYDFLLPALFRKHVKSSFASIKLPPKSEALDASVPMGKKSVPLTADMKLHRRLTANVRSMVETYASTPAGWRRRPNTRRVELDFGSATPTTSSGDNVVKNEGIESKMRVAFALRESKQHEQRDLVTATLKAENAKLRRGWGLTQMGSAGGAMVAPAIGGMGQVFVAAAPMEEASMRKRKLEAVSKQLRELEKGAADRAKLIEIAQRGRDMIINPNAVWKPAKSETSQTEPPKTANVPAESKSNSDVTAKRKKSESNNEQQIRIDEAKKREKELRQRLEREELENKRRIEKEREEQERRKRAVETPKDALHRLYKPIFDSLWDLEFDNLGGVNPFRTVIDAQNCAQMGAPDYCDVVKKPMNLTYIQTKVNNKSYDSLQEFLEEVDLIVRNALLYNSHPENPYHVAAKVFRKQFRKLAKPLVQCLTKSIKK